MVRVREVRAEGGVVLTFDYFAGGGGASPLVTLDGEVFAIVDIGLRMLTPRELARAQGFPDSYVLTGTQAQQVARVGNSVPPPVAEALIRANVRAERQQDLFRAVS